VVELVAAQLLIVTRAGVEGLAGAEPGELGLQPPPIIPTGQHGRVDRVDLVGGV